ncbi:MAG TPA: peptidoglycan DD-metalloendopeptidase family protein [Acidimicrobiia bacterium]|nr:peptidoglycan DD-metalloendopeptidase family protein [Acidimicrobiia bacterium]
MSRITRIFTSLLAMALALPALAQVSDDDIDRARREVDEIMSEAQVLGDEVQEAWGRQFALEREITDLGASIEVARAKIAETETKLEEVAVEMYMGSSSVASIQVLFSAAGESYGAGIEYLRNVKGNDIDVITQLRSFREELDRQTGRLEEASAEQEVLTAELEAQAGELQGRLVEAQAVYDQLVAQQAAEEAARRAAEEAARRAAEEAARQATTTTVAESTETTEEEPDTPTETTVPPDEPTPTTLPPEDPPPPPNPGGGTCPVAGAVSFSDSWGDARSGGRAHQGVDMIAARNTPIVAIYSGTIDRLTNGNLSGLAIWLRANNGDLFFYAHLESFADVSDGQSVSEGQVIGYNGSSGNAPDFLPHLHFEWHPGGGAAVNPYSLVRGLC